MYKSPIEIIYKDVQHILEEEIFYAIQQVDIKVDKEELIKALQYDRKQYEKGFEDGMKMAGVRHAEWLHEQLALPLSDSSKECVRCSRCLTHWDNESNYCPNCGADMRGDETK